MMKQPPKVFAAHVVERSHDAIVWRVPVGARGEATVHVTEYVGGELHGSLSEQGYLSARASIARARQLAEQTYDTVLNALGATHEELTVIDLGPEAWVLRYQCNWPGAEYEKTMRAQLKRQSDEYDAAGRNLVRMTLVKGEG